MIRCLIRAGPGIRRPIAAKLNLLGVDLLFVVPVLAELGLRVSFWFESSPTRVPGLYADAFTDEDYWKLHLRWVGKWQPTTNRVHSLLGWSQAPVKCLVTIRPYLWSSES